MIRYNNQLKDYSYNTEYVVKKKNKRNVVEVYNNSIMTFDIEVTSAWIDEKGKIIPYIRYKDEDGQYWNTLQPLSLPYIWQFSCDGIVYYGRELSEFLNVLNDIPPSMNSIIWVHNLSYEWHFLCNILNWEKIFARNPHKPMTAVAVEYPNIEFRCSYMLTRLSLEQWGKKLNCNKLVGYLDYEKLRTPLTELTEEELQYCEQDCLVVDKGINEFLSRYGSLRNIPLTHTGIVRRTCKELLTADPKYIGFIKKLVPNSVEKYKVLKAVFAGGYTHANRYYAGETIKDVIIEHYDFASSYPACMIAYKFPMTQWYHDFVHGHELPDPSTFDEFAYCIHLAFTNIMVKTHNTYLSRDKSLIKGKAKYDNGRIISAEYLEIWVTEQDWLTISETYTWEKIEVIYKYKCKKEYLPKPLLEYMLELYEKKTKLKGVPGKEDEYNNSKESINSLYGMMVTDLIQSDVIYADGNWSYTQLTEDMVADKLKKLAKYNPNDTSYFLSYSWGVWISAYARRNLWKCILPIDMYSMYSDTDSLYGVGKFDFSWYNEYITKKIKATCDALSLDFSKTHPTTIDGKEKPLGIFEKEESPIEFKTLGCKRYVQRLKNRETGKCELQMTVSGMNKGAVVQLNDDIENFRKDFTFDKDDKSVTQKLTIYINDMPSVTYPDGYVSNLKYGIALRPCGYKLSIPTEYEELMELCELKVDELPERTMISIRGSYVSEKSIWRG